MSNSFDTAISKAKVSLLTNYASPFISTILFSLGIKEDSDIPTASVDGVNINVNPDFFMALSLKEQVFVLAHEAWHVALQHGLRLLGKSSNMCHQTWNEAGDYVINGMLKDAGFTLIDGVCYDPAFRGMSTDEVYKILLQNKPPQSSNGSGGNMGAGSGQNPLQDDVAPPQEAPSDTEIQELENKVNQIISKATKQAQMSDDFGHMPGEMEHIIDAIFNPKLPWDHIFMRYMDSFAKEDYSYRRPNRHYLPDLYLPTLYSESLGEVVFAIDASASVSDEELAAYFDQIKYVHKNLQPTKTTIIVFDTQVREIFEFTQGESIKQLPITARGGTDMYDLFDELKKRKPVVAVVFSDMCCVPITEQPRFPVVWIAVNAPKNIPTYFGKLIRMEI